MPGRAAGKRNIVAMGGGGFSEEPDNPLLDDYVLGLAGKKRPSICFLPTASGDAQGYIDKFRRAFPAGRARSSHLTLFRPCGVEDAGGFLLAQDVIYVGGRSPIHSGGGRHP
jgi:peptidase E